MVQSIHSRGKHSKHYTSRVNYVPIQAFGVLKELYP